MATQKNTKHAIVYQLKITLKGIRPPIWRRVLVPSPIALDKLHKIIQIVMDWDDSHLHQFTANGVDYGMDTEIGQDETRVRLEKIVTGEKFKFNYVYDFGDDWEHEILVEKILPADPTMDYPICIKGKRACPPDDCGGPWGYADLLATLQDPDDPDREDLLEWLGESFDSEAFHLTVVNKRLGTTG